MLVTRVRAVFNRARRAAIAPKPPAQPVLVAASHRPSTAANVLLITLLLAILLGWFLIG